MRAFSVLLAILILHLAAPVGAETFPCPASLEPQVRFWRDVFGVYHLVAKHARQAPRTEPWYVVVPLSPSSIVASLTEMQGTEHEGRGPVTGGTAPTRVATVPSASAAARVLVSVRPTRFMKARA
jgi:hypothetical protein